MISISTVLPDTSGNVIINNDSASNLGNKTARVSRTSTLDGGVYINHSGFTDGDRTLSIVGKVNTAQETVLKNIFEEHTQVFISMRDGLFIGAIPSMTAENGSLKMSIYLKQKEV